MNAYGVAGEAVGLEVGFGRCHAFDSWWDKEGSWVG